ncbi:hypothetical protein [uncultured Phycicoccus sp.]|uniref:hypothetical protein n=1 Tax=uncultured Phycicoccus sp. TaxID=661422 RepID=UPI002635C609|nr:hypothetical protein [uncultured Phycicoccus sp.]
MNVYFGVNPVRPDLPSGHRGRAEDVVRLAALFADLDVKDGSFRSLDEAHRCVGQLSKALGPPTLLIFSGHGLQPIWATDPSEPEFFVNTPEDRSRLQALLRRFGRFVANTAHEQGASVDQVFELSRMLRAPGTHNLKVPEAPVAVRADTAGGHPVGYDHLVRLLDERDVGAFEEDAEVLTSEASDPANWPWPTSTCRYFEGVRTGWATDRPRGSRHNWLVSQCTRLAVARRNGCLTVTDHERALEVLHKRFDALLSEGDPRVEGFKEFEDAIEWGVRRAATKSTAECEAELGGHAHEAPAAASASTQMVDLANRLFTLGRRDSGEVFATRNSQPHLAWALDGSELRSTLAAAYYEEHHRVPKSATVSDAISVLEGQARGRAPQSVSVRVAEHDGAIWIDMGDQDGKAIHLHDGRWEVASRDVPVIFARSPLTAAMPMPAQDGDLDALWDLVNVSEDDRPVVLAWLVAALIRPTIAHPILAVFGEQGTGKSTTSSILMSLFDPTEVLIRKPPGNIDEWVVQACGSYGVALDNMSEVRPWLSDSLCRAVTGEADVRRRLYTNGDLVVFSFRRVILLNGIDVGSLAGDLTERVIELRLPRIHGTGRKLESELLSRWQRLHPKVLSGLLDLAAKVQSILPSVKVALPPRMADFAHVLAGVDTVLGTKGLDRYLCSTEAAIGSTAHDDPFIAAMMIELHGPFDGTSAQLLSRVGTPNDPHPARTWPKDSRAVSRTLRRAAPGLRQNGWEIEDDGARNKDKVLKWSITPPEEHRTSDGEDDEREEDPRP